MVPHVGPDPLAEGPVADLDAELVEDGGPAGVLLAAEHLERQVPAGGRDEAELLRLRRPLHVAAVLVPAVERELLGPVPVLEEQVREVGREPLVEPDVVEGAAGEEVPEPLVGELVGHEALARVVGPRLRRVEEAHVHRGGGGVLHAAVDEVPHRGLRVARVGVGTPRVGGEELHHGGGAGAAVPHLPGAADGPVVLQRDLPPPLHDRVEPAGDEAHEVGGDPLLEPPVVLPEPAVAGPALHEDPVGDGLQVRGHRREDLHGGAVVGEVVAGEPPAVVVPFPLAVHLEGGGGALRGRGVEVEARRGPGPVGDRHGPRGPAREGLREADGEDPVREGGLQGGALPVLHRQHLCLQAVEAEGPQGVREGGEGDRRLPVHGPLGDARRHPDREVDLVEVAGRRVERTGRLLRPGGGGEGGEGGGEEEGGGAVVVHRGEDSRGATRGQA